MKVELPEGKPFSPANIRDIAWNTGDAQRIQRRGHGNWHALDAPSPAG